MIYQDVLQKLIDLPFRLEPLNLNRDTFSLMRVEMPIPKLNLIAWLEAQSLYPKIYFENSFEESAIAALGSVYSTDIIPEMTSCPPNLRLFGGMDFYARLYTTWDGFPQKRFDLPLIAIEKRGDDYFLCLNRVQKHQNLSIEWRDEFRQTKQTPLTRIDLPDYFTWENSLDKSLNLFKQGVMKKVVLSRQTLLTFEKPLSSFQIGHQLNEQSQNAVIFIFQYTPKQAFIGASPETLYQRHGSSMTTHAIAGTRPRGNSEEEDHRLKRELISSAKEQNEFQIVKEAIASYLTPLCTLESKQNELSVVQTARVQHLCYTFKGKLTAPTSDHTLIHALHPTPAVGGFPRKEALKWIRLLEPYDRGWYAAPVGWISSNKSHFIVAIRSALVTMNQLSLFAGAGIVAESSPQFEWNELNHKISQFMS